LSADLEGTNAERRAKEMTPIVDRADKGTIRDRDDEERASFKIGTIWQIQATECLVLPSRHSVAYYLTISI